MTFEDRVLLALDPSLAAIGWCTYNLDTRQPRGVGVYHPIDSDLDAQLLDAKRWLSQMLDDFGALHALAIELPVYSRNPRTLRSLAQLCGVLRCEAYATTNKIVEVLPSQRLTVLGLPGNLQRDPAKEQVLHSVNMMFPDLMVANDDIADAIAIALAAEKQLIEEEWANL